MDKYVWIEAGSLKELNQMVNDASDRYECEGVCQYTPSSYKPAGLFTCGYYKPAVYLQKMILIDTVGGATC